MKEKTLHIVYTCGIHHAIYFLNELFIYFLYGFICFLYTFYIHPIHIEGQDEGQKVATRKVEDGQKTLFPRNVWGPLGCHLLSSLVPKSRFRGSEKTYFSKKVLRLKKMQNYPLSIFHAAVRPESLPGADLSTFQKITFSMFSAYFGAL